MRKYITLILILIGLEAFAQPYVKQFSRFEYVNGQRFDSTFRIFNLPTFTGDTVIAFNPYTKKIGLKILSSSGGTWGSITGTLSNQTDLQNALNLKLNISDTAAMLSPYALSSEVPTYLAGRGITKSGVTFRLDTTQYYTWTNSRTRWNAAPTATPNYGLVSFGSGAFDGVTSGFFSGAAAGTLIAGNLASGSTSDLINLQLAGVSKFKVTSAGVGTLASDLNITGFTAANGGLSVGNPGIYATNYRYNGSSNSVLFGSSAGWTFQTATTSTNNIQIGSLADLSTRQQSAAVQIDATTKGFLPPRMTTTEKNAISSPAEGLIVYDLTLHKLCLYTGSAWETITSL